MGIRVHVPAQLRRCLVAWGSSRNTKTLTKHMSWDPAFHSGSWIRVFSIQEEAIERVIKEFYQQHQSLQHTFVYLRSHSLVVITAEIHPCQYSHTGRCATELFELLELLSYSFVVPTLSSLLSDSSYPLSLELSLYCCNGRALSDNTHTYSPPY